MDLTKAVPAETASIPVEYEVCSTNHEKESTTTRKSELLAKRNDVERLGSFVE